MLPDATFATSLIWSSCGGDCVSSSVGTEAPAIWQTVHWIHAQATVSTLRRAGLVVLNSGAHYSPFSLGREKNFNNSLSSDNKVSAEQALREFTQDALELHAALVGAGLPDAIHLRRRFCFTLWGRTVRRRRLVALPT